MAPKRELKRRLYKITKTNDNLYALSPAQSPKGFVASGGGGKGIGYVGLIQTMEKNGITKNLTHVCGASAGAMTVSLLAIGMSTNNINKLVSELNIVELIDNEGLFRLRGKGLRLRNILETIYVLQIKEHLKDIEVPEMQPHRAHFYLIKQKIKLHTEILKKAGVEINSVDDIIKLTKRENREKLSRLDREFARLPKKMFNKRTNDEETPRITFNDLENLRPLLPKEQQHLIKKLSVVTTNQTKKQLEVNNIEHSRLVSISEKVQQSGAHPILFSPSENEHGESIADGGILDNMPSEVLAEQGIHYDEMLGAKIETETQFHKRVSQAKAAGRVFLSALDNAVDSVTSVILGGRISKGRADVLNREKVFHQLDNMIYINSGAITTTTLSLSSAERLKAIASSAQQAQEFFDNQTKFFDNPLIPILYLGKDRLDSLLIDEEKNSDLFVSAAQAKAIFLLQTDIVKEINEDNFSGLHHFISQCSFVMSPSHTKLQPHTLNPVQQEQALSLILKQVNFLTEGKLEQYLINQIAAEDDAQKVGFFTQLLILLYKPIAWVLSLFCKTTPVQSKESTVEQAPQGETKSKESTVEQVPQGETKSKESTVEQAPQGETKSEETKKVAEVKKQNDEVFTPRRIYSLFAHPELDTKKSAKEVGTRNSTTLKDEEANPSDGSIPDNANRV